MFVLTQIPTRVARFAFALTYETYFFFNASASDDIYSALTESCMNVIVNWFIYSFKCFLCFIYRICLRLVLLYCTYLYCQSVYLLNTTHALYLLTVFQTYYTTLIFCFIPLIFFIFRWSICRILSSKFNYQ